MRRRMLIGTAVAVALAVALGWSPGRRYYRAGKMLTALSSAQAAGAGAPPVDPLVEEEMTVPAPGGAFRARIFRLRGQTGGRGLVVAHGIHHQGMNESRMVPFARQLARAGLVVL